MNYNTKGSVTSENISNREIYFGQLLADAFHHLGIIPAAAMGLIVSLGIKDGIERGVSVLMPVSFVKPA